MAETPSLLPPLRRLAERLAGEGLAAGRAVLKKLPRRVLWTAAAIVVALSIVGTCAYAWVAREVTVVADGKAWVLTTIRSNVEGILAQAGVELRARDLVEPAIDVRVAGGGMITVKRAVGLTIIADGQSVETTSAQGSVREVVLEAGIELGTEDRTEPPAGEAPVPGSTIRVVRVEKEFDIHLWRIPRKVYRREDEHLELGLTRVVEKGSDGVEEVTFCTTYEDGVKISRKIVDRRVLTNPVAETILVGTSGQISRGGETIDFRRAIEVLATGYYWGPECTGKYADGYTSIGLKATRGVIAVDPRVIPLRTRVYVDGYGFAIAGDVGSAIKGSKIDCCFDTYQEALAWGRRKTKVYLLW